MTEGSGLPVTREASANQNVRNNHSLRKKPEEWVPCLAHKLKHSYREKEQLVDSWKERKKERKKEEEEEDEKEEEEEINRFLDKEQI